VRWLSFHRGEAAVNRRWLPNFVLLVGLLLAAGFLAGPVFAAPKDAAALKLDHDAIYSDYLATKFSDAEKKIKQALAMCKDGACSPKVRAQLHRDLGIVYIIGSKRNEDGKREFAEAIRSDPNIGLIKDLTTPELETIFASAYGADGAEGDAGSPAGGEDIVHRAPREQVVMTPLPLYAKLADGVAAAKVQVRYKSFGATEWKTAEMRKIKAGYGIELSCLDVGSTTGELKYYIQAFDAGGDVVAANGSRSSPHTVSIKNALSGDAPHLPGRSAPVQCANTGECPPDLPGCPSSKAKRHGDKGWGATCEASSECQDGLACKDGACQTDDGKGKEPVTCKSAEDCEAGQSCTEGVCGGEPARPAKKNWLSFSVQQDSLLLPSSPDACSAMQTYTCFFNTGDLYDGTPLADAGTNKINGGFGLATTRVLVGFDRLLGDNLTAGVRLGYAFRGGPTKKPDGKAFLPLHFELRASYWFGSKPLGKKGLRPYVVAAGGIAEVDASVLVIVDDPTSDTGTYKLAAWRKTGQSFVAGGAGAVFALNPNSGLLLEVKLQEMLGASGTAITLSGGYAFGL
jgi:hypothetical protein